ncbi:LOW QUALITY PROTEIN: pre-mRNA 3' end processing protein WDR33-like [Homalodisca vitripennis]|uniref:LOW QUALITY PROTEIN: pre-mRNA 3' end processing protein WDR33-like n=1 Tax=Homalodisca vitripennis TaxID=197043 RepID=UPI001EEB5454|nr:LOW QUALITY PROTEIN: pre-mRNA 3' end processing protein WDR33-like [Homalodisca vitripennis]
MNNVKMFLAHKEAIRGISFSPSDSKFATCSDDGTIKIWDFQRCQEERTLRGHGADVKCVHWHPQKGLVISGSKDNQQPVKLWDPKTGQSLATLHAHKSTVMDVKWNNNGNWLVTASRDHLLKLFDVRNLSSEVQTFRGHKKESSSVAWHPYHEGLFCSGGSDGAILFWHVGADKEVGAIEQAHDSIVWTLAWHPLGHILCSGSNDHSSKFWTRNRPGDLMRDKYNLNTLPANMSGLDENEIDDLSVIPGMGPEDKVETINPASDNSGAIPGLDIDSTDEKVKVVLKKVPYSKPIPKNFQAHWNHAAVGDDDKDGFDPIELINQLIVNQPGVIPLAEIEPESLIIYGKQIDLKPTDDLTLAIKKGSEAFARFINSGAVEELNDVRPYMDLSDDESKPASSTPVPDNENQDSTSADHEDSWQNSNRSEDTQQSQSQQPLLGSQDQDMRHLLMQPPPSFPGLEEQRLRPPPPLPSPQQGEMFRSMAPPEPFRPPDNFRQGFPHDIQNQNRDFQRPMPSREFNRTPDFREDMYRGPGEPFRPDFGMRGRQDRSPPPFRGRNQGFINDQEDTRSSFPEDQDMRASFGNGDYDDDGDGDGDQWNNEERFRDSYDWNDEGMDEDEPMDEDYRNGDRRYQQQSYQQKKFPRGPRSRGSPRGGRGMDRGRRMRGRGRGGSRGGGFRPRGRNPRR